MNTIALAALALVVATGFALPAFADASSVNASTDSFDWTAFQNRNAVTAREGRVLTQIDVRKGKPLAVVTDGDNVSLTYVKPESK